MSDKFCLRCLLRECGREDTLKTIIKHIKKISAGEKASEKEYSRRLGVCKECEFLEEGTCLKCGCYPEMKAAFNYQKCPMKKW